MAGRRSSGNSASKVEPMTWVIFPVAPIVPAPVSLRVSVSVAVICVGFLRGNSQSEAPPPPERGRGGRDCIPEVQRLKLAESGRRAAKWQGRLGKQKRDGPGRPAPFSNAFLSSSGP